jgi:hypothetical protein
MFRSIVERVFFTAWICLFAATGAVAQQQSDSLDGSSGGAASDPTSSVNFQDFRYRYFDLTAKPKNTDPEEHSFEAEGSYAFNPRLKLSHKIIGVHTNRIGTFESDLRELSLKPIFLTPGELLGFKVKYALGVEWLKDLGDAKDGTGSGTNKIAPLAGIAWVASPKDTVITLAQYFHSYSEDTGIGQVRQTGPRIIWLRSFPEFQGWLRVDWKGVIDHEASNEFSSTLELQLGKMLKPKFGVYGELLLGDTVFDTDAYDIGFSVAARFMY